MTPLAPVYRRPRLSRTSFGAGPLAALVAVGSVFLLAQAAPTDDAFTRDPAYKKMVAMNRDVRSSIADIEVHTKVKSFPPMSLTFRGHSYFKAPDRQRVVFDNVPGMIEGMVKDSPSIAPAALWPQHYHVTVEKLGGGLRTFHLTALSAADPISAANVTADAKSGLMSRVSFVGRNGSTVSNDLTYMPLGKHMVVATQSGSAAGKGYKADVTTTFSNYRLNAAVDDAVFTKE